MLECAGAQKRDAVGHDHGFFLIVRDEDESDADFALERFQFALHLLAQIGVERGKRFIEQEQVRAIHQGAGQRDALLLAAADLRRLLLRVRGHSAL